MLFVNTHKRREMWNFLPLNSFTKRITVWQMNKWEGFVRKGIWCQSKTCKSVHCGDLLGNKGAAESYHLFFKVCPLSVCFKGTDCRNCPVIFQPWTGQQRNPTHLFKKNYYNLVFYFFISPWLLSLILSHICKLSLKQQEDTILTVSCNKEVFTVGLLGMGDQIICMLQRA